MPRPRAPYSLYKKISPSGQPIWYARFWDYSKRKFGITRSTGVVAEGKRERRTEAEAAATRLLASVDFATESAETDFLGFLEDFWRMDGAYAREKALVRGKPLSRYYVQMNHDDVRRHLAGFPPFEGLGLKALTAGLVKDWMVWAAGKNVQPRRINSLLQCMRVAVRYAFDRGDLKLDPFLKVKEARVPVVERGVLRESEVALVESSDLDPLARLAVVLGLRCALRRGEVRGLQWRDIDEQQRRIHVRHNFISGVGVKEPKNGKDRWIPLPDQVQGALNELRQISPHQAANDFVLFNLNDRAEPVSEFFFRSASERALRAIGISREDQGARRLSYHSFRHTALTLARLAGVEDLVVQAIAGHQSPAMMNHYSHAAQAMDFDRTRRMIEGIAPPKARSRTRAQQPKA